ncbi:nuclear hormone receptor HR96-like isoform X2 [Haliotis rubra]|uniref:nuclear hormone receptor HR96-like isoform X2 n=1 Tax=Haliotis rubra TaxID=36100 RepID=UPI001EE52D73|nr:nuclear hormone receptor HR96-like isoform X2 [Haliotis rubra]
MEYTDIMLFESSDLEISVDSEQLSDSAMCGDPTVSSMAGSKKDKTCLVCGDRALGYNFNAISCESCKAFFRRNAHKTIRGRCEGKCDVNIESRSFCKRCRLAKCYTVGMRKDMILSDEQKKMRKTKIIMNKLRRQGQMAPEDTYSASESDLTGSPRGVVTRADSWPESSKDFEKYRKLKLEDSPGACSHSSGQDERVIKYPPWLECAEVVSGVIQQLKDDDRKLMQELMTAHENSQFLSGTTTSLKLIPSNPTEFVNVAEGFVRRVIKVAKNIAFFKELCKDDQIALLKGSVVDIMMLRSAVNYDPYTESWSLSTMNCLIQGSTSDNIGERISAEVLKMGSSESASLFFTYSKFIKSLMSTIHGDLIVLKILIIMSLFSADRGSLVNQEQVHGFQEQYAHILQQYILLRFPEEKTLFARVVMKLTDLRNINEVHTKMLLKMKVEDIEPLLLEIFDLPL